MNWSILGKILTQLIPQAIEVAEHSKSEGKNKKQVAIDVIHEEFHQLAPEIASHPKVLEAVSKATDALVTVQNVVAHVEGELEVAKTE